MEALGRRFGTRPLCWTSGQTSSATHPEETPARKTCLDNSTRLENQLTASKTAKRSSPEAEAAVTEINKKRLEIQGRLAELEDELVKRYGAAAGAVYELERVQSRLPADAAAHRLD